MAKLYNADDPEILQGIADYSGDVEAYKHDNAVRCQHCLVLWDISGDDITGLAKVPEGYVCEDELDDYNEAMDYDPMIEHGTHFVRGGSVVG